MMPSELASMIWKIRRDGCLRSLLGLFVLFLLLTEAEKASIPIFGIVAAYLIVVSTWTFVAAERILRDFCVKSAAEVERLKTELEEIRSIIDSGLRPSPNRGSVAEPPLQRTPDDAAEGQECWATAVSRQVD